jgi:hypothetical protein
MSHQDGFVVPKGTTLFLGIFFLLFSSQLTPFFENRTLLFS